MRLVGRSAARYPRTGLAEGTWTQPCLRDYVRERATTPDPTDEQMKRAGARIVAPSGLDEGTLAT